MAAIYLRIRARPLREPPAVKETGGPDPLVGIRPVGDVMTAPFIRDVSSGARTRFANVL
jgi:hypothetical protein